MKEIRDALPYGSVVKIAKELNRHRSHVDQVLRGVYQDDEVIKKVEEILKNELIKKQAEAISSALQVARDLNSLSD